MEDELSLLACSQALELNLLLRDREGKSLQRNSFFKFIQIPSQAIDQNSMQDKELNDTQLNLLCTTGSTFMQTLSLYALPSEAKQEAEQRDLISERMPLI